MNNPPQRLPQNQQLPKPRPGRSTRDLQGSAYSSLSSIVSDFLPKSMTGTTNPQAYIFLLYAKMGGGNDRRNRTSYVSERMVVLLVLAA